MVDVQRGLEWMENWLGIPVQVQCTMARPEQLKTLHHRDNHSDSKVAAPETQEEVSSQIEGASPQMVEQLIQVLKREVREHTQDENHTSSLVVKNEVGTVSLSTSIHGFPGHDLEIPLRLVCFV